MSTDIKHTPESRTMELAEYLATPMGKAFYRGVYENNLRYEQRLKADDWSDERTQGELGDDARNLALQDVCSHLGFDPVEASADLWQYTPRSLNGTIARSKDAHKIARAIKLGS